MKCKKNNQENNEVETIYRKIPRINGWSYPPHPLQFVAWFFLIVFNVVYHFAIVPVLPYHWQPCGYLVPGIMIAFHIVVHIVCISIDPADPNVRKKKQKTVKTFDRSEHQHVIENFRCYLCDVSVGTKSKHCSTCNKCVSDFDHHCKWLNNCVGERNYRLFIMCLTSAIVTCFIVLCVCIYVGIAYWVEPRLLHPDILDARVDITALSSSTLDPHTLDYRAGLKMFGQPVSGTVFFIVICIMVALLTLTVGLLGHLLGFHIYLMYRNLSTYEYIVLMREIESDQHLDIESRGQILQEENIASPGKSFKKNNKVVPMPKQEEVEMEEKRKKINDHLEMFTIKAPGRTLNNNQPVTSNDNSTSDRSNTKPLTNQNNEKKVTNLKSDRNRTRSVTNLNSDGNRKKSMNSVESDKNSTISPGSDTLVALKKTKKKFNRKTGDSDSEIVYPSSQFLPTQPQFSVEQHYVSPVGLSNGLPETYLEQHIVHRFPANVVRRSQIPLQLEVSRNSGVIHLGTHPMPQYITRPMMAGNINIAPVGPAFDYDSDLAESLHEIPIDTLASSHDSASYTRSCHNQLNQSWNNEHFTSNQLQFVSNNSSVVYYSNNQYMSVRMNNKLQPKLRPVVPPLDLSNLVRTTECTSTSSK